jgi:hypothetical protein
VDGVESVNLDYRRTARRPGWADLPDAVRAEIAARVGGVSGVAVAGGGFTPSFAATVSTDTSRVFVKAADTAGEFGQPIVREAAVLAALPPGMPVPVVRWFALVQGWAVLCLDVIEGRMPGHPWVRNDVDLVLDAQTRIADALATPSPALRAAADPTSFSSYGDEFLDTWRRAVDGEPVPPAPPWLHDHLGELAALEAAVADVTADADGLMHYDLRPDNILICPDRRAVVLDWNWTRPGPAWVDTVMLLSTAFGTEDVDTRLAEHPTTRNVDPNSVDVALAAIGGSLLRAGSRDEVASSPSLRTHQHCQGTRQLTWLAHRRHWLRT